MDYLISKNNEVRRGESSAFLADALLDSKHNNATSHKVYNVKIRVCGSYYQTYLYENTKVKIIGNKEDKKFKLSSNLDEEEKTKKYTDDIPLKIEERSIIRSKLSCQALAKSNIDEWKTFITLTFEENITDIKQANKRFKLFVDKVRRVMKEFKYLCIPEFQKRGAIHYHLLTNVSMYDSSLMYQQEDNKKFYHIKYWLDGFTSVEEIKGDPKKIIGYISKYMTKDIDDRLFNHNRFFYSRNIIKPYEQYLDLSNQEDIEIYKKIIQENEMIYHNEYINPYDNSTVQFLEFTNK